MTLGFSLLTCRECTVSPQVLASKGLVKVDPAKITDLFELQNISSLRLRGALDK